MIFSAISILQQEFEKRVKHGKLMLDSYNLLDLFFFFLNDWNNWHCFYFFVVILFAAAFFALDEYFNCSNSLSKWYLLFACAFIKFGHSIRDWNPEVVGKHQKIILLGNLTILCSFFTHFGFEWRTPFFILCQLLFFL